MKVEEVFHEFEEIYIPLRQPKVMILLCQVPQRQRQIRAEPTRFEGNLPDLFIRGICQRYWETVWQIYIVVTSRIIVTFDRLSGIKIVMQLPK